MKKKKSLMNNKIQFKEKEIWEGGKKTLNVWVGIKETEN